MVTKYAKMHQNGAEMYPKWCIFDAKVLYFASFWRLGDFSVEPEA